MVVLVLFFVCVGSWSFGFGIDLRLSYWISNSVNKVMKIFEIFSQPDGPVRKPNQPVHWVRFFGMTVLVLCFVCIGSWSFGVGIALRLLCWIPNSVWKVLKSFEIFYQPSGPFGKPNHPVHWVKFSETAAWVVY